MNNVRYINARRCLFSRVFLIKFRKIKGIGATRPDLYKRAGL
ncbi:MAG: hypothetical protein SO434_05140 [Eubacteriales bacterium]|nr:hypothetical protein [Eubacteriales bacterium]